MSSTQKVYAFPSPAERRTAIAIAERLLQQENRPTAIMCSTDLLALATVQAATKLGLMVPDDIAICGFDDFPFAEFVQPALTTVRVPAYEMGGRPLACSSRDSTGDGVAAEQIEFSVELLLRGLDVTQWRRAGCFEP